MTGEKTWSTANQPPGEIANFWSSAVADGLLEVGLCIPSPDTFTAELRNIPIGPMTLSMITAGQQILTRTPRMIARSKEQYFDLVLMRSGTLEFWRSGSSVTIGAGECVLIDSSERYQVATTASEAASLHMPANWLRGIVPNPEAGVGRNFVQEGPWGEPLARYVEALASDCEGAAELCGNMLAAQLAGLLLLAIGAADAEPPGQRGTFRRLVDTMAERFWSHDLSPGAIATQCGISARSLFAHFTAQGTTFGEMLYRLRLDRAQRLLRDRRFDGLSIANIAWRCGFSDGSHFARRFKQRFGMPPAQFREQARAVPSDLPPAWCPDEPERARTGP